MFKIIGVIIGYLTLGFFGGIAGFFIGSIVDRARRYGTGGVNPLSNAQRQAVFLETLFVSMGKLAKADGRVSEQEITHVEDLMQELGMTAEHRQQAIALFKRGAEPTCDIEPLYQRFMSVCGHTLNLKQVLLVYLIVMALSDGHAHPAEEALLVNMARRLGYSEAEFRQLMSMVQNQAHFASSGPSPAEALDDAYQALGVSKDSSDQDIKRTYRKLISQYHPDKLIGQGLPEDMVAIATEKAKEIQLAYDLIEKSRKG